jgi:hypothetical protein
VIEITFEEDRQHGVINGPRAYFHDPVGTGLELIDLTSYVGNQALALLRRLRGCFPSLFK